MLNLTHNLKMQIKIIAKYHFSSFRSAQIIKLGNILSWRRQKKRDSHMFLTEESLRFVIISQKFLNARILWPSCFTSDNSIINIFSTCAQRFNYKNSSCGQIGRNKNLEIIWK